MRLQFKDKVPPTVERASIKDVLELENAPSGSPRGSTYWKRLLSCPRESKLYQIGLRPRKNSEALDIGTIFHHSLEHYYLAHRDQLGENAAQDAAWQSIARVETTPGYEETWKVIERMLINYFNMYSLRDKFEVVDAEVELSTKRDGFEYSARIDTVVIDKSVKGGALRVLEHKSASRLDQNTIDGYALDIQTVGQHYLMESEVDLSQYPPFLGVTVNIVTKHVATQFERVQLAPHPKVIEGFKRDMREWQRFATLSKHMGHPRNLAACVRRYGRCDYFELCRNHPTEKLSFFEKYQGEEFLRADKI